MNAFGFLSLEIFKTFTFIPEGSFCWTQNYQLTILSKQKYLAISFWPPYFWWETYCHLNWCFPIGNASLFSLAAFKKLLSLSLVFMSLLTICLNVNFFEFILFQIHSTSQCLLYQTWKVFSHYLFKYFFRTNTFPLFLWKFNYMNIIFFIINPWLPETLFIFFQSFFLSLA